MNKEGVRNSERLYELLLHLYPARFKQQFGDEMKYIFSESLQEARHQYGRKGIALLWGRILLDFSKSLISEHLQEKKERNAMHARKSIAPSMAAIAGLVLFLPGMMMIAMLMLNIEPTFITALIPPAPPDQPDVIGSLVALTLIVLLPLVAFTINLMQIRRTMREGGSILARPVNVVIAVASFAVIAALVIGIIVDQYPCWIGVPNCD